MNQDLTLSMPCAAYGDTTFELSLVPYKDSAANTPFEFFWKLDLDSLVIFDADQACGEPLIIPSDLTLAVECANYYGTHMKFKLLPLFDTSQLLCTIDLDSVELLDMPVTLKANETFAAARDSMIEAYFPERYEK